MEDDLPVLLINKPLDWQEGKCQNLAKEKK